MMTPDEFERLKRRFGVDATRWPAPHRQEARAMSMVEKGSPFDNDNAIDRLVLDAASMETEDENLTRQVLMRVNAGRGAALGSFLSSMLLRPIAMTACATLLFLALAIGGYRIAATQAGPTDEQFLALASGSTIGDDLLGLSDDDGAEDAL